jgi:hypothetical protein
MKKIHFLTGTILGLLLTAATPLTSFAVEQADFDLETTKDLYDLCVVKADNPNYLPAHWACKAFIKGAVQYHDGVSDKDHLARLICYPEATTIEDGQAAFATWAAANQNNTKYMKELPVIGLVRALSAKYPCSK